MGGEVKKRWAVGGEIEVWRKGMGEMGGEEEEGRAGRKREGRKTGRDG